MKKITVAETQRSVEALVATLRKNNLPQDQQRALIGALVKTIKNKPVSSSHNKKGGKSAA